jgi:GTP cyclohydrolase I
MRDVQASSDTRGIAIDRVGVSDLRYPITVLDRSNKEQHTVATLSLLVDLPHQFKGPT